MTSRAAAQSRHFDRESVQLCKGLAIVVIVLHNYFHWVEPIVGQNEFAFSAVRIVRLWELLSAYPQGALQLLLAYFGHYGVQLFLFLSAYGLARRYPDGVRWLPFMGRRVARIYPTLALAIVVHAIFVVTIWNPHFVWYLKAYMLELSMLYGVWPERQLLLVGPWWFFSMIFQFYALFPLLCRIARRYGGTGLAAVGATGLAITVAIDPFLLDAGLYVGATVIGNMPVLCLGIYLARSDGISIRRSIVVAAAAIFALGNALESFWYLAPIAVTILFVALLRWGLPRLSERGATYRLLEYYGYLSLPLFAFHGLMRAPFVRYANAEDNAFVTLALGLYFLLAATAAAQAIAWTEELGRRRFVRWRAQASDH